MTWSLTHAKLHTHLRKHVLLPHNSHILMAVSGGQDSLCLAKLLIDLQPKWQWSLGIVHCNHRWRDDAADNANHVVNLSQAWDIPAWVEVADSPPKGEAAARTWRYQAFSKVARQQRYSIVVTGHTLSDRAETVLYNLIRGTGLDGISALSWQRPIDVERPALTLVRPLLNFNRQQTGQFCTAQNIPVWEDSTNKDLSFKRNRIRHELLPYLATHFNPQVEQALSQMGELTAADTHHLTEQANQLFEAVIVTNRASTTADIQSKNDLKTKGPVADSHREQQTWEINRQQLKASPLSLQRRVIKKLLQLALPEPPNFQGINKILDLLEAPNGSRTDTYAGNLVAEVRWPSSLLEDSSTRTDSNTRADKESLIIWLGPTQNFKQISSE